VLVSDFFISINIKLRFFLSHFRTKVFFSPHMILSATIPSP